MKKGFTIVELLASIAIMVLIIIISVPAYEGISKTIKEQNLNSKISMIERATESYINKYYKDKIDITDEDKYLCYTIEFLISKNVISPDNKDDQGITDPLNGGDLDGLIVANYDITNYKVNIKYSKNIDGFDATTDCDLTNNE